jgi:hypothetical protein
MVWDITADWALYARELSENADADEKRVMYLYQILYSMALMVVVMDKVRV